MELSHTNYKVIRIAICDDDTVFMRILTKKLKRIFADRDIYPEITCFNEPEVLLAEVANNSDAYFFYFLDIEMPVKRGTTVANELRMLNKTCKILFITSHCEEVLDAFHYRADAFVPKTLLDERLPAEVDLMLESARAAEMEGPIFFQVETSASPGGRRIPLLIRLKLCEILYFESVNKKVVLHAEDATYTLKGVKYQDIRKEYAQRGFVDTHRTLLVNSEHIKAVGKDEVILDRRDERLQLSRRMHNHVVVRFMDVMGGFAQ